MPNNFHTSVKPSEKLNVSCWNQLPEGVNFSYSSAEMFQHNISEEAPNNFLKRNSLPVEKWMEG